MEVVSAIEEDLGFPLFSPVDDAEVADGLKPSVLVHGSIEYGIHCTVSWEDVYLVLIQCGLLVYNHKRN